MYKKGKNLCFPEKGSKWAQNDHIFGTCFSRYPGFLGSDLGLFSTAKVSKMWVFMEKGTPRGEPRRPLRNPKSGSGGSKTPKKGPKIGLF